MLKDFELKNYGPINEVHGKRLGKINLILGKNSTVHAMSIRFSEIRHDA